MLGNGIRPTTILYFLDIVILYFLIYISLGRGSWLSSPAWSPAPSSACVAEAVAIWPAASEQNLGTEQWGCFKTIQIMATLFYS